MKLLVQIIILTIVLLVGGKVKVQSVTLDYLYSQGQIDNIAYIHLDVEGFESNVSKVLKK